MGTGRPYALFISTPIFFSQKVIIMKTTKTMQPLPTYVIRVANGVDLELRESLVHFSVQGSSYISTDISSIPTLKQITGRKIVVGPIKTMNERYPNLTSNSPLDYLGRYDYMMVLHPFSKEDDKRSVLLTRKSMQLFFSDNQQHLTLQSYV